LSVASPRLTFDAIDLDLPHLSAYRLRRDALGAANTADAGVTERVRTGLYRGADIAVEDMPVGASTRLLQAWWSWAERGRIYTFARDSAKTVNTTLAMAAAAGATSIFVADATGLGSSGTPYRLRAVDGLNEEIVTVRLVNVGTGEVSLSVGTSLKFAYSVGDVLRDPDFWPAVVSSDRERPFFDNVCGMTVGLHHSFREAA
jgi:hypothetical protein